MWWLTTASQLGMELHKDPDGHQASFHHLESESHRRRQAMQRRRLWIQD